MNPHLPRVFSSKPVDELGLTCKSCISCCLIFTEDPECRVAHAPVARRMAACSHNHKRGQETRGRGTHQLTPTPPAIVSRVFRIGLPRAPSVRFSRVNAHGDVLRAHPRRSEVVWSSPAAGRRSPAYHRTDRERNRSACTRRGTPGGGGGMSDRQKGLQPKRYRRTKGQDVGISTPRDPGAAPHLFFLKKGQIGKRRKRKERTEISAGCKGAPPFAPLQR